MVTWLTKDDGRLVDFWPQSVDVASETALVNYLDAARIQCETYLGPARVQAAEAAGEIPPNWIIAQAMQAKALATSPFVNQDDGLGGFGETVSIFPMDWKVQNLLRPRGGMSTA